MPISPPSGSPGHFSGSPLPKSALLHELFSAQARAVPERIAVSDQDGALSYAELDAASSRLAAHLRAEGVKAGTLVGLCLPRGTQLVSALLGILKAGGAYVPIDPRYPAKRIAHIIQDSGLQVLIGDAQSLEQPLPEGIRLLGIDALLQSSDTPLTPGDARDPAQSPAYVIYTSGSTGTPKGVQVTHANASALLASTQRRFEFNSDDVWSMFHSIGFDFSVWEIWGALAHGGHVAIVPYEVSRSPQAFQTWLAKTGVTVLSQTPSAFRGLDQANQQAPEPLALRYVVFGGEALPSSVLQSWVARHGDARPQLVNMYGITEATVHTTFHRVLAQDLEHYASVPIGQPLDGWILHLLDEHGAAVADGQVGELFIEGAGVAPGYLNRPELTAERFVSLPGSQARAYRSGDLLSRDAQGVHHYKGRADQQLKVRGFRIEAGEVQACLQRDGLISASHVCAQDYGDGDVRLLAYVVPADGSGQLSPALRDSLAALASEQLPDFMRPSAYVALAQLPLTDHGKIDSARLPSPSSAEHPAAQQQGDLSEHQRRVLEVWCEDIGLKGIGLDDDFFDFGGTSLALIRALSVLKTHYRIDLNPGVLADGATARVLAQSIEMSLGNAQRSQEQAHV
ncbi:amino acid adenylation domain-containing protein [Pseudomonas sp. NCHU5208]|uniref:amino acid adenylation domain-containing protein n=1 Tax=unclassified Pseudomonas TaxID=196821 RepID=UPI003F998105